MPFEMTVRLADPGAVMCSYNQVDTVPVQSSRELLTGLLREEYGFDGVVMSDLNSVAQLWNSQGVAASPEDAVAMSIAAGLDLHLGNDTGVDLLVAAVKDGLLALSEVDRAAARVLQAKVRSGFFDAPLVDESAVPESLDTPARRALARRVAERSIVLLRNAVHGERPVLPLQASVQTIAVIGPNADRPLAMLGNYSYPVLDTAVQRITNIVDASSHDTGEVRPHMTADELEPLVESVRVVTVLDGVRARAGGAAEPIAVVHAPGCPVEVPDTSGIAHAVGLAAAADVAVVVVGDQSGIFEAATVGEAVESATCALPGVQRELVEAVVASGTPTVVVLVHGRPFVLDWMAEGSAAAPAILSAWFPGEEGGHAVASVLFGDTAPGGRLPVSFPRHAGVGPAPYNRTFTREMSYVDTGAEPVFPFGHGLTYTTMRYGDLRLSADAVATSGVVEISCTVTNEGDLDADEVVQLYTRDPVARSARPRRELKGFRRVPVGAGRGVEVTFELAAERLALWDPVEGWVVEPGTIEIMIGSSSEDIRLESEITLTGDVQRTGGSRVLVTPVHVAAAR